MIGDSRGGDGSALLPGQDLEVIFEIAGVGVFQAEFPAGRFLRVNRKLCEITGYPAEELLGMTLLDLTHPDDREEHRVRAEAALRGEASGYSVETRYVRKDGSAVWVAVSAAVSAGERDGAPARAVAVVQDVTERRRSERVLGQSEERFRLLVDGVRDYAIFLLDPEGRVTTWNQGAQRIKGYDPEEIIGRHFSVFYPEEDPGAGKPGRGLKKAAEEGSFEDEGWRVRKDGTRFWASVLITALRDPDGRLRGFSKVTRDVTEKHETEKILRESEARLRAVVEAETECVKVLAADGSLLEMNPAGLAMIEADSIDQVRGKSVLGIVVPEHRDAFAALTEKALGGKPGTLEFDVVGLKGTRRTLETHAVPLRDEGGLISSVLGVTRDVTEKRRADRELRKALRELADLKFALDESAIVATTDVRGRITYANDKFCEISGYSRGELVGQDHRLVNSGHHPADYVRGLWRTIARGRVWRGELRNRAKDGSIYWVDTTIVPFLDERGKPYQYTAIRHDVTARKEAEEELRESRESLQAILDNTTAVIYVKDLEGRYSLVNRRFEELFDVRKESAVGKTDLDLFSREEAEEYRRNDLAVLRSGGPVEAEETVRDGKGTLTFFSVKFPMMGPDGVPYATCGISTDITFRKRTEKELRASEKRFRATFEQASVGVALVGTDGEMWRVNRKICEILGFDAAALTGMNVADVTHPEDLPADRDLAGRALAGEMDDYSLEKRYVRKDGEVVWANVAASLVRGDGGEPEYFIGVIEDVTERRRAEDALREAEERYRTLVEGLPAVTYVRRVGGDTLSYASPQLKAMLGYAPGEYLADPDLFARTVHPDDREWVLSEDERTNGTGEPFAVECRRITKDGRVVWVHDEAHLVRDAAGTPIYWQGFLTDITDRKRVEAALRQSEELYRSVVEQAVEGIFLLDVETMRILEANAALGAAVGYTPEELKGMSFYDLSAHDKEAVDRNVERTLREGSVSLGVRQYRRKDGGLVDEEISISLVPYESRRVMCVVAHDVTERRRAERALGQIREAERNRIARELHDSILQDIVYALQEIQILQVLGQGGDAAPGLGDAADALRRSVEGLRGAIFELRLKETLDTSFAQSLENLVDLNRRMARGAYEVELAVGEEVPSGLPERLGRELVRIVQEALTNVRRHSGARRVHVELGVEGGTLRLEVSDDGRGFDPGRSRVGVGRHSMRQRAQELGGELEFRSGPGRGTRVLCRVPLAGQE